MEIASGRFYTVCDNDRTRCTVQRIEGVEDNMCVYVIFRCVCIGRTVELKIIHITYIFKLCVVEKTIAVAEYSIETKWCPPSPEYIHNIHITWLMSIKKHYICYEVYMYIRISNRVVQL